MVVVVVVVHIATHHIDVVDDVIFDIVVVVVVVVVSLAVDDVCDVFVGMFVVRGKHPAVINLVVVLVDAALELGGGGGGRGGDEFQGGDVQVCTNRRIKRLPLALSGWLSGLLV